MASSGRAEEKLSAAAMQQPQEEEAAVAAVAGTVVGVGQKRPREEEVAAAMLPAPLGEEDEEIFVELEPLPEAEMVAAPLPPPPEQLLQEIVAAPLVKCCHQCRQYKTELGPICNGFRSNRPCSIRYCTKCILYRYGRSEVEAAKQEGWTCPKCTRTCNCSCCRKKKGELPTGKLTSAAKKNGFTSARELLECAPEVFDTVQELREVNRKKRGTKRARGRNTTTNEVADNVVVPQAVLSTIAGLQLEDKDVGGAMQFLEFCRTFSEFVCRALSHG